MSKVTIVIVNWNGIRDTIRCLESIERIKKQGIDLTTVVVDNGSTDGSVATLKKKFAWVVILALPRNLGFTGGNNAGMRYAISHGGDFVWLLNNDTLVHPDALRITKAFEDEAVGIAGSKIYFAPGHEYHRDRYKEADKGKVFWYAGGLVDWDNMYASHKGVDEVDHGQYDAVERTPFISGCSMMIRRAVIESIGYLDEKFYLYLEDLDYCLRAKKRGYELVYYPSSVIWHVNAGSSGGAGNPLHDYYITRNRLLVGWRYASLRTKLALVREGARFLLGANAVKRWAVWNALVGKWGKQYEPKKIT